MEQGEGVNGSKSLCAAVTYAVVQCLLIFCVGADYTSLGVARVVELAGFAHSQPTWRLLTDLPDALLELPFQLRLRSIRRGVGDSQCYHYVVL